MPIRTSCFAPVKSQLGADGEAHSGDARKFESNVCRTKRKAQTITPARIHLSRTIASSTLLIRLMMRRVSLMGSAICSGESSGGAVNHSHAPEMQARHASEEMICDVIFARAKNIAALARSNHANHVGYGEYGYEKVPSA